MVISHSHNASQYKENRNLLNILKDSYQHLCGAITRPKCDYLFACSEDAGKSLFGRKGIKQDNFKIICNAIDSAKYIFSQNTRREIRKALVVSD